MTTHPYQYVALRCVPRVEREEFLNVGVIVFCQSAEFLEVGWHVSADRVRALDPGVDLDRVAAALDHAQRVCAGDPTVGAAADQPLGVRFGFLRAPRSTVVQPGPVHGGLTADPANQLAQLLACLVS